MSPPSSPPPGQHPDEEHPHFDSCHCSIYPSITHLPLHSHIPTPTDPILPGQCIYHHRLSTRDRETAIFIQYAPEIDELKEVLSTGMVRFRASGSGSGNGVSAPGGGTIVLKKATSEEIGEAVDALWVLVKERERLVREVWGGFVGRWGGRVERGDDGRMFVVDGGTAQKEEQEGGEEKGKKKMEGQVEDDEADPYVKRMREVQARMDDLEVAQERVRDKRERAGRAKEEYEKGSGSPSGRASGGS